MPRTGDVLRLCRAFDVAAYERVGMRVAFPADVFEKTMKAE